MEAGDRLGVGLPCQTGAVYGQEAVPSLDCSLEARCPFGEDPMDLNESERSIGRALMQSVHIFA